MFRLAREMVERGGRVITTTTTQIFASQIALAPAHVLVADATRERVAAALDAHRHVLVVGPTNPATSRASGPSLALFGCLRAWFPDAGILNEADGSRTRPFKAPAEHEPVIPMETTLVVPVVGADVFGKPLNADHVHRPELVSALGGAPLGAPVTPELVARVLAHPTGGCKGVPPGARVVVLINKVESAADRSAAGETVERLLREAAIHSVVTAVLHRPDPVLEIHRR
jgi:molybdenum cofactor cytidylyltransferase